MKTARTLLPTTFAFLLAALASGCSGSDVTLRGKVTLDGKPVDNATIRLHPKDNKYEMGAGIGTTDENGNFEINFGKKYGQQIQPGTFIVTVTKYVDKDGKVPPPPSPESEDELAMAGQEMAAGDLRNVLPPGYERHDRSDLTIEVKPGLNEGINIELKKGGGKPAIPM